MSEMTAYDLKGEDRIDSRDVIAAQDAFREEVGDATGSTRDGIPYEIDDDERALLDFDGESEVGSEWTYGATMILESDFVSYAQELAEDIGAIPNDVSWPCTCIDWERAADKLRQDCTSVSFLGYDYLVRA